MEEFGTVIGKKNNLIIVRNNNTNEILKFKNKINADLSDNIIINKENIVKSKFNVILYFIPFIFMIAGFFIGMLFNNQIYQFSLMVGCLLLGLIILFVINIFYLKKEFKYNLKLVNQE